MRRTYAVVISVIWFALAPGVITGLIPYWLTRWESVDPAPWVPLRLIGGIAVLVGAAVLIHTFFSFVAEGRGTPVPAAPPQQLVVGGLYRYVRNPMYLAVMTTIAGQVLVQGQLILLAYLAVVVASEVAFVRMYEEPALRRKFGAAYDEYRRAVPGWRPRFSPWTPQQS
jgi:protein-S-isoprenylcysteine O-methyltransferase Ste14